MTDENIHSGRGGPTLSQAARCIDLRIARTFRSTDDPTDTRTSREMAIAWANEELKAMERCGRSTGRAISQGEWQPVIPFACKQEGA